MPDPASLLPGTLDLLVLKAASLGPLHGYGVLLRIQQISGGANRARSTPRCIAWNTRGFWKADWGVSENNRRSRFYRLTPLGRRHLGEESTSWNRLVAAMAAALDTNPGEV